MYNNNTIKKGAAAVLLTLLVTSMVLVIVLSVSFIIITEIKLSRSIEESVMAFYAADAGAEKCLFEVNTESGYCGELYGKTTGELDNGSKFEAEHKNENSLSSIGKYGKTDKEIVRKVELTW